MPSGASFFTSALVKSIPAGSLVFLNARKTQASALGSLSVANRIWHAIQVHRRRAVHTLANQTVSFGYGSRTS